MTHIRSDLLLAQSAIKARIHAPADKVDIATWLLSLPDAEYQRCAPGDHISAGYTTTDDGRPMSINVEQVGDALLIEHYVGEITEERHCRMVSTSDIFTDAGRSTIQVIWELTAEPDGDGLEFTNEVTVHPTDEFMKFLEKSGISLEQAAEGHKVASTAHNKLETPLFAKSIERAALAA